MVSPAACPGASRLSKFPPAKQASHPNNTMSKNKRRNIVPEPDPLPVQEQAAGNTAQAAEEADEAVAEEPQEQDGEKTEASSWGTAVTTALSRLPVEKPRRIGGFLCLFASLFLFLSFLSHFFFWWIDFDIVQQMQSGSIWADNNWQVRNIGGRLGAYLAYLFVNLGFGIASFIVPLVLFLAGLHLLRIRKFHWLKIFFQSAFGLLWISVLAGSLFHNGSNYIVGGSAGLHASRYLQGLSGNVGLIFLLLFTLISYLIISYNLGKLKFPSRRETATASPDGEPAPQSNPAEAATLQGRHKELPEETAPEADPLEGMTLSSRIRLEPRTPAGSDPSPSASTGDEPLFSIRETCPEPVLQTPASPATVPGAIPADGTGSPARILLSLEEESPETSSFPASPHAGETSGNHSAYPAGTDPEKDEDEEDPLGEMKVVDTRTLSPKESSAPVSGPTPVHYGLDTPYDPRLELSDYRFPTLDLLEDFGDQSQQAQDMEEELLANKKKIVDTLQNYGIDISKISATIGPTVTLYEIVPAPGIRISKIKNLEDDIALSLSALGIRIIAPIPGKGTIGIEVPNSKKQIVPMRDMLTCEKFRNQNLALPVALGKTISNEEFVADLAKMPHVLVAGATGQGKSVGLNAIIASLLYSKHPAELKFVMVDPKKVELSLFNKIERHYLAKLPDSEEAIITDTRKVVRTLNSLCIEMDNRYDLLKDAAAKNIKEYNKKFIARRLNPEEGHRYLPYIVLIIDEFADLIMTAGKEIEQPIARLAQLARAIGIHLVIATQRPSVNIITGLIKANFPARIAFKVMQKNDSRTILDANGADQLIGRGDMLISMGDGLTRLQCAFIDTPEIERITEFIGSQRAYPTAYLLPECPDENGSDGGKADLDGEEWDSMFREAAELVVSSQQGSTSMLQRKFKLGYNRAGRIMDQLESAGIVGPFDGKKTREVKIKDPVALEQILESLSL